MSNITTEEQISWLSHNDITDNGTPITYMTLCASNGTVVVLEMEVYFIQMQSDVFNNLVRALISVEQLHNVLQALNTEKQQ